jgi:hypothetical protein
MERDFITGATCENCDENEENFRVTNTEMNAGEDDDGPLRYHVECYCGEAYEFDMTEDGVETPEGINYDDAPWGEDDE